MDLYSRSIKYRIERKCIGMKKKYLVGLLAIAGVSITGLTEVQAESKTVQTRGEAGFIVDSDAVIPIVKPGTNDDITMDEPTSQLNVNNVRLSYVPSFNFGSNNVLEVTKVGATTRYEVKNDLFKEIVEVTSEAGTTQETKVKEIPQFVQVADTSGSVKTTWSVEVSQNDYFTSTDNKHQLIGTRIEIHGQTLKNTRNLENNIEGIQNLTTSSPVTIPVNNTQATEGALVVLKKRAIDTTKNETEVDTVGSKSSIVFQTGYDATTLEESKATMTTTSKDPNTGIETKLMDIENRNTNKDVVLAVPESDATRATKYSTTLTWTLTATP